MKFVSIPVAQANVALALREGRQADTTRNMYDAPSPLGVTATAVEAQIAAALLKSQKSLMGIWSSPDPALRNMQSRMASYLRSSTLGNSGSLLSEVTRRLTAENSIGKALPGGDGVLVAGSPFCLQVNYSFPSTKDTLEKDIKSRLRYLFLSQKKMVKMRAPFRLVARPNLVSSNFLTQDLVVSMFIDIHWVTFVRPKTGFYESSQATNTRWQYFLGGGSTLDLLNDVTGGPRLNSMETVDPSFSRPMAGFHPVARDTTVERAVLSVTPEEFSKLLYDQMEALHEDFVDPNTALAYTDHLLNFLKTLFNHGAYPAYTHSKIA